MQVIAMEEKINLMLTLKNNVKEYIYTDKFGKETYRRYHIVIDKQIDVKGKKIRKSKYSPVIFYNLKNVLTGIEEKRKIVITENEELADFINKKRIKKYVATTILDGIDRVQGISLKTLDLFKGACIYVVDYEKEHKELTSLLSTVAKVIEIKKPVNELLYNNSNDVKRLVDMLDKYKK